MNKKAPGSLVKKCLYLTSYFLLSFYPITELAAQYVGDSSRLALDDAVNLSLHESVQQYKYLSRQIPKDQLPRTYIDGQVMSVSPYAWISGFYPGSLLYLYEFARDSMLLKEANDKLSQLEKLQTVTANHDLGFMMYCSFGNAYRLFQKPEHKAILIQSAKSLASRFNSTVGCIESWDEIKSLDGKRMLDFPVIIDNMMNLELLFFASKATGDPYYRNIATQHTDKTLENHFRKDFSSYHVVAYDTVSGKVLSKETHQGFSDNSTWSRGQAWAIYYYTMVDCEKENKKYFKAAQKMADFYLQHENLPEDMVPYWDFNVNQKGYDPVWNYDPAKYPEVPRDASAGAIVASALLELSEYVGKKKRQLYLSAAEKMMASLSSPNYRAPVEANGGFILMHASGGVPGDVEVDVPLSYADYYYIESLMRYQNLKSDKLLEK